MGIRGENRHWDDYFAPPRFVRIDDNTEDEKNYSIISFDEFFEESKDNVVIIDGKALIGKTTVLSNLFNRYINNGYIPIYINIKNIKNPTFAEINKNIDKFINKIYRNSVFFVNQNLDKNIILIDDGHVLKSKFAETINKIQKKYKNLIITNNPAVFDDSQLRKLEFEYSIYDMMPFGYEQKQQLVEKWARKYDDVEYKINQKTKEVMDLIKKVDKENNFINRPILLIIFLDAYEDNKSDYLMNGSKGIYYQYLIDRHIINLSEKTKIDTNFIRMYLSEYAFTKFESGDDFDEGNVDNKILENATITKADYYNQVNKIKGEFNIDEIYESGKTKNIIFSNDLIYSYFVAQHIKDNRDVLEIYAEKLIADIGKPVVSNIILFYLFFTNDLDFIRKIIKKGNSLLKELSEIKLEDEIKIINEIIVGYKNVEAGNVQEKNQEINKKIDENNYYKKARRKGEDVWQDNPFIMERMSAYSFQEISREILNQSPKKSIYYEIVESMIRLSFRQSYDLVLMLYLYLYDLSKKDEKYFKDNENMIKNIINRILLLIIYNFIELGESLKDNKRKDFTFEVLEKIDKNTALDLLKMILKICFYRLEGDTNYDFVFEIKEEKLEKNNKFAVAIIHTIMEREMNYFDMKDSVKNRIVQKLNYRSIQKYSRDPKEQLGNIKSNRQERVRLIKRTTRKKK